MRMGGLRRRSVQLALAIGLSWGVLFNTALVTIHNLGAREDIGYINGGKVFRQSGTMWYHIPGLQQIGLAPQNIGGQINLRNNEFAMLERDLRSVSRIHVDFALDPDAMLLVILDRYGEGTFWAVRLTAFTQEGTPFVNALLRYERGRVVERIPLTDLGAQLEPGEHAVSVELTEAGTLVVTVDDASHTVPFDVGALEPRLALGCGERNTTIFRWEVVGTGEDGEPLHWEESFSVLETLSRGDAPLALLATLSWLILFGLLLLKVLFETRVSPLDLLPRALLLPTPRWVFGLVCLIPWTPLAVQWFLGGLYVVYAWMTLWEALSEGRHVWRVPAPEGGRPRWLWTAGGAAAVLLAVGLFAGRDAARDAVVGSEVTRSARLVAQVPGTRALTLGERIDLDLEGRRIEAFRMRFRVHLNAGEILRADVLASLPTEADVYQVDRSQDRPEGAPPATEEEDQGPRDYELRAVSALISTSRQVGGMLRWLHDDKMDLSPYAGWLVAPGTHEVVITVQAPYAAIAVDGVIKDLRTDLPPTFEPAAVQLLAQSRSVTSAGDVVVEEAGAQGLEALAGASDTADLLGVLAMLCLLLGAVLLLVGLATPVRFSLDTLWIVLRKGTRGSTSVLLWLGWWLAERYGWVDLAGEVLQIVIGAAAILVAAFNLTQLVRQSGGTTTWPRRAVAAVLMLAFTIGTFEGLSLLYPERRTNWTHYWHAALGPQFYWIHDPMIRRLNPWFIDQRFKRRDWSVDHPGKVRVAVFGGSQTYGWGIPSMDRMAFSDQLERALHERGYTQVEVLNAAFPGVKTATGLRWFSGNLLRYKPDIVVINFVVNEFMNVDQYHVWSGDNPPDERISPLASVSLLEHWRGHLMGNHLSQIIVADVYEIYAMAKYLRWWVDIAREHNVEVVFSIEPTNLYVESGGEVIMRSETNLGAAQSVYREVGQELGVPVYDPFPHFAKAQENLWFYDTMHMSRLGHRVFAENLADLIIQTKLAPAP